MKQPKKKTSRDQAHTSKSPKGLGDFYGTGVKQKMGTIQRSYIINQLSSKKLKTPPRALA